MYLKLKIFYNFLRKIMTSSIEVTKSLLPMGISCYTILVSDIYEKIKFIDMELTDEIRLCFMKRYLNIFLTNTENHECNIMFQLTEEQQLFDSSEKVEVDPWWIRLCWRSFLKHNELVNDKVLLSCGRPNVKTTSEIVIDMANDAVRLLSEKKYIETVELLKPGLKYNDNKYFNIIPYNMACAYSLLKDKENMFLYLEMAIESGYKDWKHARTDSDFEEYFNHPRFVSCIEKMKSKAEDVEVKLSSC